jgi:hypothetical protein
MLSALHHGIQDGEQAPHTRGECEFGWFAGVRESFIEGAKHGVDPPPGERCHVENRPDLGTTAPADTGPAKAPRVAD